MPIICYDITTPAGEITTGEYQMDSRYARTEAGKKFNRALHDGNRVRSWRKGSTYAEPNKPRVLELIGKRWFQKSYGNTYFTARAVLDGEVIAECPKTYGYGEQWKHELMLKVQDSGKLPRRSERTEFAREWAERIGVTLVENVTDVARERDL